MVEMVVIGGGPAGMAAALQCSRSGMEAVLFEKGELGGLLREANLVENYLGFPGGLPGAELCSRFSEQLRRQGVEVRREEVLSLDHDGERFVIRTAEGEERAEMAIMATGTVPSRPGTGLAADGELVFDSVLPLADWRGMSIAVLGGGDAAYDYALRLSAANTVTIVSRSCPRSLPLLRKRAEESPSVSILDRAALTGTRRTGGRLSIDLMHNGSPLALETDALLLAVGRDPADGLLRGPLRDRSESLIKDGVFYIAGDVVNGHRRQAAIAAADGIRAAMGARETRER